jgi:preprotein translocase SecE subunit
VNKYILGFIAAANTVALYAQAVVTNGLTNAAVAATNGLTNAAAAATNGAASAATTAATTAARTATRSGNNDWITYAIWGAVIAAIFGFLWSKGYLIKIRNYFEETQEELKKCSWPTRDELKGSTVVVMVTIVILGAFTVCVDWVLSNVMRLIT